MKASMKKRNITRKTISDVERRIAEHRRMRQIAEMTPEQIKKHQFEMEVFALRLGNMIGEMR